MHRFTLALLLPAFCCNVLFSQFSEQKKLIAANHIQEKHNYYRVKKNGEITGDSALSYVQKYNSRGCVILDLRVDQAGHTETKSVYDYLNDSILLKITNYKNDQEITGECILTYDDSGNLIQNKCHWLQHSDKSPDTRTSFMEYDNFNRKIALYEDAGKGKKLILRYEYDAKGNKVKWYNYVPNPKKPGIKLIEYDAQNRPVKFYELRGHKKKFAGENTYNNAGQIIAQLNVDRRKIKKYFGGYDIVWRKKSRTLTKYEYDEMGLLIRLTWYNNSKMLSQEMYKYVR